MIRSYTTPYNTQLSPLSHPEGISGLETGLLATLKSSNIQNQQNTKLKWLATPKRKRSNDDKHKNANQVESKRKNNLKRLLTAKKDAQMTATPKRKRNDEQT